jgi:hypothetical protein
MNLAGFRFLPFAAFVGLLSLPLVQTLVPFITIRPLAGVEAQPMVLPAALESWLDGRLQKSWEERFNAGMGLRPLLVRTDNQVNMTLFRRPQKTMKTEVVPGEDDFLYERIYLDRYSGSSPNGRREVLPLAKELRRLQDLLAARGVGFLLVISPSKAEIYPEQAPPTIALPGRESRKTEYDVFMPLLAEEGVNVLDAHRLFKEERRRSDALLFSRGGVHWNHYGATVVVAEMMRRIEGIVGRDLPGIAVTGARRDDVVWRADNDLADLLNLWWTGRYSRDQFHPVVERTGPKDARSPNLLLIGDSFVLTLGAILKENDLTANQEILYYFRRSMDFPGERSEAFDPERFDVGAALQGRDAVIIETNEILLPRSGFGFTEKALADLK